MGFRIDSLLVPSLEWFCCNDRPVERIMKWMKPRIVEIAVGLEINSYACAVVK